MKIQKEIIQAPKAEKQNWCSWIQSEADPSSTVFLDIETTGFSRRYDSIYLIGLMYQLGEQMVVEQYLASSPSEEPELLRSIARRLLDFQTIITFNGDAFDLPFIRERMKGMRMKETLPELQSIDLYREYRGVASLFGWDSCRLKEIEKNLGMEREDEKSGGELIDVFYEYSIAQDPSLEKELLLHNFEDVLDLADLLRVHGLLRILKQMDYTGFHLSMSDHQDEICLQILLSETCPLCAHWQYDLNRKHPLPDRLTCHAEKGQSAVTFRIPAGKMKMKYYLPDYKDYYILEDGTLMHHSLGNPPNRRKAVPRECFLEKEDLFFPCSGKKSALPGAHLFQIDYEDKQRYYSFSEVQKKLGSCSEEVRRSWLISYLPEVLRKEVEK